MSQILHSKLPEVTNEKGVTVITMGRECESIDETVLDGIREFLSNTCQQADPPRVVLDLTRTKFFGSSFIEVLFRIWNSLHKKPEGAFALVGLTAYCAEVLKITHLNTLWQQFSTREEALQKMGVA